MVAASGIIPAPDIVEVDGNNFGHSLPFISVSLTSSNPSQSSPCDVCYVTDRVMRCITTASHTVVWSLVVTVVGQSSPAAEYSYSRIMAAPAITTIDPLDGPTTVRAVVWLPLEAYAVACVCARPVLICRATC